jgi:peroxiredoxin
LIKVGDGWRAIELPQVVKEGEPLAVGGVFFQTSVSSGVAESDPGLESSQAYEEYNRILNSLEKSREKGDKVQLAKGNAELAKLLRQFIDDSASDEKSSWIKQFADQVAGAYQNGEFLEGLKLLNDLIKDLDGKANESDMGYAHYRMIQAQSSVELGKESDDPKVIEEKHQEHLGRLKKFIEKYTASEFVPEALYQLATSAEVDKPDEASKYYARIVKEFPDSTLVPKAQGAYTRINSKGRAIELAGKTMDSQEFRLSGLKGSVVVVHYWGAWPGSERDIDELRRIYRKYAASGIEIVGVGVENNAEKLAEFLKENAMPWTQLANERGLDGKLAVQLGIAFLPTTMLIGRDGTVINPRIQVEQLEAEIRKLVRVDEAQKPNAKK